MSGFRLDDIIPPDHLVRLVYGCSGGPLPSSAQQQTLRHLFLVRALFSLSGESGGGDEQKLTMAVASSRGERRRSDALSCVSIESS